jgi:transposase
MEPKAELYIPACFRSFQGFQVKDIKEFRSTNHMEIILESEKTRAHVCGRCDGVLGAQDGRYWLTCRHMRVMSWTVTVSFWREKRHCAHCKKIRAERIDFVCAQTPHVTKDLAWWLNRLTEITSVLAVSKLETLDKMTCYKIDKEILIKLLQGYKIPPVTHISVDEVYARGKKQQKEGETRDDLFLTVIVDLKTHKVIWVSQSRRKEALDQFFAILGKEACDKIVVVATDQYEGYSASVKEHCQRATIVWDRFHIVQTFNEAVNEDRKVELERLDPEGKMEDLINGKYRHIFLTKATNRSQQDKRHIEEVAKLNEKMSMLEIIKEHLHKMFEVSSKETAKNMLCEIYEWAHQVKATNVYKWVWSMLEEQRLWNYFDHPYTTGVSEGVNRAIKGLKWQAYGYKDMQYFALKILQKCGYLNSRYHLMTV